MLMIHPDWSDPAKVAAAFEAVTGQALLRPGRRATEQPDDWCETLREGQRTGTAPRDDADERDVRRWLS